MDMRSYTFISALLVLASAYERPSSVLYTVFLAPLGALETAESQIQVLASNASLCASQLGNQTARVAELGNQVRTSLSSYENLHQIKENCLSTRHAVAEILVQTYGRLENTTASLKNCFAGQDWIQQRFDSCKARRKRLSGLLQEARENSTSLLERAQDAEIQVDGLQDKVSWLQSRVRESSSLLVFSCLLNMFLGLLSVWLAWDKLRTGTGQAQETVAIPVHQLAVWLRYSHKLVDEHDSLRAVNQSLREQADRLQADFLRFKAFALMLWLFHRRTRNRPDRRNRQPSPRRHPEFQGLFRQSAVSHGILTEHAAQMEERALLRLQHQQNLVLGRSNFDWNSLVVAVCYSLWGDLRNLSTLMENCTRDLVSYLESIRV